LGINNFFKIDLQFAVVSEAESATFCFFVLYHSGVLNRNTSVKTAFVKPGIVTFNRGNKFFELSNHLGNVLVTVSDKKTAVDDGTYSLSSVTGLYTKLNSTPDGKIDYYKSEIITANDYYPFGSLMPGRRYSSTNTKYRYGFNGKENDNDVKGVEGGQQDYGFRIYDPRIGKFLSPDPLGNDFSWWSPYQFAGNTPINTIDLDGLEVPKAKNKNKTEKTPLQVAQQSLGAVDLSNLKAKREQYKTWKELAQGDMFANITIFGNNTAKAGWNQLVDAVETGLNTTTPGGKLKLMTESVLPTAKFLFFDWQTLTPAQQLNFIKSVLSDPETYENLVATLAMAIITEKFLPNLKIPIPKVFEPVANGLRKIFGFDKPKCFIAGTKIFIKKGFKNIENIIVGDTVWAYNEETLKAEFSVVTYVFKNKTDKLVNIGLDSLSIWTTPEHPFFVDNKWLPAKQLSVGDSLTLFGNKKQVVSFCFTKDTSAMVYNFTVNKLHNYYITTACVLVHNDCSFGWQNNKAMNDILSKSVHGDVFNSKGIKIGEVGFELENGVITPKALGRDLTTKAKAQIIKVGNTQLQSAEFRAELLGKVNEAINSGQIPASNRLEKLKDMQKILTNQPAP
jgi:RHS repeat-associated protein